MSGDNKEIRFQGAGVSPGLARGVIHVVRDDFDDVPRYHIEPSQIGNEIARFEAALVQTRVQILERSEEHTSELQSHSDLVCRLLLEKKKKNRIRTNPKIDNSRSQTP